MHKEFPSYDRYFLSYTGIKLPLKLTSPLERSEIENRNTYFGANVDAQDRFVLIHKVVYGNVDLEHKYDYHANGVLSLAEILDANDGEEEIRILKFDESGKPMAD